MKKMHGMPSDMGEKYKQKYENVSPHITAEELYNLCEGDAQIEKLVDDMLEYASRYVQDVWEMQRVLQRKQELDTDEWQEAYSTIDRKRSQLHDTFIDSIAILSRNMANRGLDNEWVRELAPAGTLDRARCGKFAIMLMYQQYKNHVLSIESSGLDHGK